MKKNIIYLLTLLLLCCFRQNIHAEYFRNLNLGNGLSQFSVMSICQDSLGRMWFGTHEGINIYDGHHIRYYKGWVESGPGEKLWLGNSIDYIHCGNDGNIYFIADRNLFTTTSAANVSASLPLGTRLLHSPLRIQRSGIPDMIPCLCGILKKNKVCMSAIFQPATSQP